MTQATSNNILALDVGEKRIGVAVASFISRMPRPLMTLDNSPEVWADIKRCMQDEAARVIVVGLPRNLSGNETAQTATVLKFVTALKNQTDAEVYLQDEAVTSYKAKQELQARGKPYAKGDIDSLAATYILEDFLNEHPGEQIK